MITFNTNEAHSSHESSNAPSSSPEEGAKSRINATNVGILALTSVVSPVAALGLFTWWAADSVTGGLLSGHNHV